METSIILRTRSGRKNPPRSPIAFAALGIERGAVIDHADNSPERTDAPADEFFSSFPARNTHKSESRGVSPSIAAGFCVAAFFANDRPLPELLRR